MGVSIGLVGLGAFGKAFADLYYNHPAVDRIAVCDREADRVKAYADRDDWKTKLNPNDCYTSLDDICASDLDALVIITQPWLHAPQCIQAMESGKHVYSAVPIISLPSGDEMLDWCDKIIDTSKRTGQHYMLGETSYYHPDLMFCRRKAREGAFGDFVYTEGEYFHDVDANCNLRDVQKHRRASAAGKEWIAIAKSYHDRGILDGPMHYPTHSCSYPVSIMGAHATKVTCYGFKNTTNDSYFTDSAFSNETALFEMSNGATARICEYRECAGHPAMDSETGRVVGTAGTYSENKWMENKRTNENDAIKLTVQELTDDEMRDDLPQDVTDAWMSVETTAKAFGSGHRGSHTFLTHEFVDSVANNRTPAINAWEASRYMAMGVMAHKSALKDGERLDIPDWGDAPA
jgi:predicted dehydrogenase